MKPHYPAHVFHRLKDYPALWCEQCGAPILPRLTPPNKAYRRAHLEPLHQFRRRKYCDRACAGKAKRAGTPIELPTPRPAVAAAAAPRRTGRRLDPLTRRLLVDALQRHDGPEFPLAEFFQPARGGQP